jgi:SAM-dependent methyltransferase
LKCRHCGTALALDLIDLGAAPPSNAYLDANALSKPERTYPLRVKVCTNCWLVQTEDYAGAAELFDADYAYFSSYSDTWLAHARAYVTEVVERFNLGPRSLVAEVAANDGYLLQYVAGRGIPCYGVEPAASTARAARERGIDIVQEFFSTRLGEALATHGRQADLMVANNVLAHVPDLNDFVGGFARLLKPAGIATFEFADLVQLVDRTEFDTIYHEHFSYLSLFATEQVLGRAGLEVFDVQQLPTHGGSLRLFVQHRSSGVQPRSSSVEARRSHEAGRGVATREYYSGFQQRAERIRDRLRAFLAEAKQRGETVAGYGAAAKGNTLLNFAGVGTDLVAFVADRNPAKQGKLLPGSRIPIVAEDRIRERRPKWILILPWNLRAEITRQLAYVRVWGGTFVTAVPQLDFA